MKTSKYVLSYQISEESTLLINTLTGAVDLVDSQVYRFLQSPDLGQGRIDRSMIERLKKRGYLVESDAAEEARLQMVADTFKNSKKRLSFTICPTYSCNLRCTYCFEGELTHNGKAFMNTADVGLVFQAIDELMQTFGRESTIELFGGEPLLPKTKPLVEKIFKETAKRSLTIGIVTNGTYLDKFSDLLNANRDLIRSVQITLDGPQSVHDLRRKYADGKGTFASTRSAIDTLLKIQINTAVRVNVDRQNIDLVPELYSEFIKNGWVDNPHFLCNLSPVRDHAQKGNYDYFLSEDKLVSEVFRLFENPAYKKVFQLNMLRNLAHIRSVLESGRPVQPMFHYCEANNLESMVFGPDGYIYACTEVMGDKEHAIGEFRPTLKMYDEAVKLWNGRNVLAMGECKECDIALLCGGGCAYSALAVNGDINKPVCNRVRETILAYLDYIRDDLAAEASG